MKTITIINQKGGVGKSTTALSVGAGLVLRGYSVLLVELDPQRNMSTTILGSSEGLTARDVLLNPDCVLDAIRHTNNGDIICADPGLVHADTEFTGVDRIYHLKDAIDRKEITSRYDFCIIDTPPSLGILTINAMVACSGVIIPAQPDAYSMQGISQLMAPLNEVRKRANPDLEIIGILFTRFDGRTRLARDVSEVVSETAKKLNTKLFLAKIRECTMLKESQGHQKTIFEYAPKSNAAKDYGALVDEITQEEG